MFVRIGRPSDRTRIAALAIGVAYLTVCLGPLPAPPMLDRPAARASGERFPCENCGCGCGSAKECWSNCCCHSLHERLVWAIRVGVQPPVHVRISDAQWEAAARAAASIASVIAEDACCGGSKHGGSAAPRPAPTGGAFVTAANCKQVVASLGGTGVVALRAQAAVSLELPLLEQPERILTRTGRLVFRSLDVPTPPPRCA